MNTSKKIDKLSIAIIALSALVKKTGFFPTKSFEQVATHFQKPELAPITVKAIQTGIELVNER